MLTPSEVSAHRGIGYGHYARAHLGWLYDEPVAPKPKPKPAKPKPKVTEPTAPIGGASPLARVPASQSIIYPIPLIRLPLEEQLALAAERVPEMAQDPDVQAWCSSVLGQAPDISTDRAVAGELLRELLREARDKPAGQVTRAAMLAACFLAVGFPTNLVGHGGPITLDRALTAVYLDGAWAYADPNVPLDVGEHLPFVREKFFWIPDLPTPALQAELAALRERVRELEAAVREQGEVIQELSQVRGFMIEELRRQQNRDLLMLGAVLALGGALIWLASRDPDD